MLNRWAAISNKKYGPMVTLKAYIRKKTRNKSDDAEENIIKSEIVKTLAASHSFAETPLPSIKHNLHRNKGNEVKGYDGNQEDVVIGASVEHSTEHVNCALETNLLCTLNGKLTRNVEQIVESKKNLSAFENPSGKNIQLGKVMLIGQHDIDTCVSDVKMAKARADSCKGGVDKLALCKMEADGKTEIEKTIVHNKECSDKEECLDQEWRKKRLRSFAETPFIQILPHRYGDIPLLSPQLLKITRLFTVILSICKFNSAKDMMTIYHKSKKCIENLLNKKVSIADIEQINWLVPEALSFRKIAIMHLGEKVRSFTIEVVKSTPRLVEEKIMQFVKDLQMERKSGEDVVVPRRPLFSEEFSEKYGFSEDIKSTKDDSAADDAKQFRYREAEERGRRKALTVLERIRERERMRREDFVAKSREQEEVNVLRKKIESYFAVENKKSERVDKLVRVFCIHNGKEYIKKLCEYHKCFVMRMCEGEIFLVLNT